MENPEKKGFGLRDAGFGINNTEFCIPEAWLRMPDAQLLSHSDTFSLSYMQEVKT
jgi:hypothetical protein